jgi:phosphoglycolate phosphatase
LLQTEDPATLAAALGHYRERFSPFGLFENTVYPYIPAGLAALQAAGHRMWVATSKPTLYAQRIVEHFALASYFVRVHGSELSGVRADKTELVKHVLMVEDLDPTTTWMIGDRLHDVRGGRANGIRTAGVLWGYGSARELTDAGAEIVVDTMDTLIWHLGARIQ